MEEIMLLEFNHKTLTESIHAFRCKISEDFNHNEISHVYETYPIGTLFLDLISYSEEEIEKLNNNYSNILKEGTKPNSHEFKKKFSELVDIHPFFDDMIYMYDIMSEGGLQFIKSLFHDISIFREYIDLAIEDNTFFDYKMLLLSSKYGFIPEIPSGEQTALIEDDVKEANFLSMHELKNVQLKKIMHIATYDTEHFSYKRTIDACSASLFEILKAGLTIKKCRNCGKYFIPFNRSDTMFCDRITPQNKEKTCKEYNSQNLYYEKLKADETKSIQRKIYQQKQMLSRRNPDIIEYKEAFEQFKIQSKQWKTDVKNGIKTETEFLEWLKMVKEKKV